MIFIEYVNYQNARNAAWRFLLDNNVSLLPVDLISICKKNNIKVLRDVKSLYLDTHERGVTFLRDKQYNVLLNAADPLSVQRYTIAHELGHIYMKHPLTNGKYGRTFGTQREEKSPIEYQAERFAIDILAPACVLWGLKLTEPDEISKVCRISLQAATYRAERMKILYKRNAFLKNPMEKEVYEQFYMFINNQKK